MFNLNIYALITALSTLYKVKKILGANKSNVSKALKVAKTRLKIVKTNFNKLKKKTKNTKYYL